MSNQLKTQDDNKATSKAVSTAVARQSVLNQYKHWQKLVDINFESPKQVESRCIAYLNYVDKNALIPSYEGLAMALKINAKKLQQIEQYNVAGIETAQIIMRYKGIIETFDYQMVLEGNLAPSVYQIRSNYFSGIVSRSQVDISPKEVERTLSPEDMLKELQQNKDIIDEPLD